MCDFSADGVWDKQGRCCSADDLPISFELIARLREWQKRYDYEAPSPADEDYIPYSFDDRSFNLERLAIAKEIKRHCRVGP